MSIYKNYTSAATNENLIVKGANISGRISKILIANVNTSNAVNVTIDLNDGTNTYTIIKEVEIPVKSSLVLEDNVEFNSKDFNLSITTSGTAPLVTVIVK